MKRIIAEDSDGRWEQFKDWAFSPNPCPKHGSEYLKPHGWDDEIDIQCTKCQQERHNDWISKREDYLKRKVANK